MWSQVSLWRWKLFSYLFTIWRNQKWTIYHMDYSEKIPQLFKYEPQYSHFNKKQYSLHCTVMHNASTHHHKYIFHQSNHLKHNFAFTFSVINYLLSLDDVILLIHLKNYNCKHNIIFLDSTKLKMFWKKLQHFLNNALQSYYDLFQVNWLVQN